MNPSAGFLNALAPRERRTILRLATPEKIQDFLDRVAYCGEDDDYHCPLVLANTGRGCCFAGALFGAAALRMIGKPPLVVELKSENDDDHILAVYKRNGRWGAVAKSHYAGLRAREPVYKSLRELAMSYFEHYYNRRRERTLRSYSVPLDLRKYDALHWMTNEDGMNAVADAIDRLRHVPLFPRRTVKMFTKVDMALFRLGIMKDAAGTFVAKRAKTR
jgi:hypothetical protein